MATGISKTLTRTEELGSEETFDFTCLRCAGNGNIKEAKHYCPSCDDYYCDNCLQVHKEFSAMKDHKILGVSQKIDWGKKKDEEECPDHYGQKLTMFCGQHEALCCTVCVAMSHTSCNNMSFIQKLAKGIMKSQQLKSVRTTTDSLITDFKLLKAKRENSCDNLDKSSQNCLEMLKHERQQIDTIFNELETKAMKDLNGIYGFHENIIVANINVCEDSIKDLEHQQGLLNSSRATEQQLFIRMTNMDKKISQCRKTVDELSQATPTDTLRYTIDPSVSEFLKRVKQMGRFTMSANFNSSVANPLQASHEYTVLKKRKFNVRLKEDLSRCYIQGICKLPDGNMLVSDFNNRNLKQVKGTTYTIVDHCTLPYKPYGVCCTGPQEAAVALDNHTIQFVSVGRKMKTTRSIQLGHGCFGLAHHTGKLYVTERDGIKVYVYSTTGKLLHTVPEKISKKEVFSNTKQVCVSGDGTRLYVADACKGLVTLDSHGTLLSVCNHPKLSRPTGVCTDTQGNVFLCGWLSNNVVQFEDRGARAVGEVISEENEVEFPRTVWYDTVNSKLIVSSNPLQGGCDTLDVFTIKTN